jgi:hypothetical protein
VNDEAFMNNLLSEVAVQRDAAMNQLATANAKLRTLENELVKLREKAQGEQQSKPE